MKRKNLPWLLMMMILFSSALFVSSCASRQAAPKPEASAGTYYTCSMHPQIHEDKPGNCPICGMKLIKVASSSQPAPSLDSSLGYLTQPVTQTVVGSFKVIEPVKTSPSDTITMEGYIGFDKRDLNTVSTRVSGRIEKLYIKYANQSIGKGQPLMDIYSPELLSAQRDLLQTLQDSDSTLTTVLKQRLINLGMRAAEIQKVIRSRHPLTRITIYSPYSGISMKAGNGSSGESKSANKPAGMSASQSGMQMNEDNSSASAAGQTSASSELLSVREGMYVNRGQTLFSIQNINRTWAILNVFTPDIWQIHTGDAVHIFADANAAQSVKGRVDFIPPGRGQNEKTTRIRVYLNHLPQNWKIGTLIHGRISTSRESNSIYVPLSAVNRLGLRTVVWVQDKNRPDVFHVRNVKTAVQTDDAVQITKGIEPGDKIVANAAYMVDSDSFIE